MADNDVPVQICLKVAEIIQAAKPKARVYPWWILTQGLGESIPHLLSADEDEWGAPNIPWVHAYMIDQESDTREVLGHPKFTDRPEFRLWAFYGWKIGDATKNSSHVFIKHVKDVQNAISKASKFHTDLGDLGTGVPEVTGHDQWQLERMGTYWFGKQRVHVAQGTLIARANLLLDV